MAEQWFIAPQKLQATKQMTGVTTNALLLISYHTYHKSYCFLETKKIVIGLASVFFPLPNLDLRSFPKDLNLLNPFCKATASPNFNQDLILKNMMTLN